MFWSESQGSIDEFLVVLGGQPTPCFFLQQNSRKQFCTLPVVNDNEIVRSTSDGVEGKSGLIYLVRFIRSCWCRRFSQFLATLDTGWKENGVGWPPKTIRNSSIFQCIELFRKLQSFLYTSHSMWKHTKWNVGAYFYKTKSRKSQKYVKEQNFKLEIYWLDVKLWS